MTPKNDDYAQTFCKLVRHLLPVRSRIMREERRIPSAVTLSKEAWIAQHKLGIDKVLGMRITWE